MVKFVGRLHDASCTPLSHHFSIESKWERGNFADLSVLNFTHKPVNIYPIYPGILTTGDDGLPQHQNNSDDKRQCFLDVFKL